MHLSIYPPTHTPNMFSWFPIYFPLRTPVHVPSVRCCAARAVGCAALRRACAQGAAIEAQLWRCGNHAKVWYEWCTTAPQVRTPCELSQLPALTALHTGLAGAQHKRAQLFRGAVRDPRAETRAGG